MYSPDVHYLVCKEISKDLRRGAARHQLIRTALLQRPDNRESLRKIAGRIGTRLVSWGLVLQHYEQGQQQTLTQQR